MKESNNEKNIYFYFYTTDEKLCEYAEFLGERSKNWDKLIQSGTPGQHTGKTGTVGMFVYVMLSIQGCQK